MEHVEKLLKTSLAEIERILDTKTVVGEQITVGETILIPLLNVGFGFGAGGGSGKGEMSSGEAGSGEGVGAGVGGGVKPIAMIIIDANGVRIEPIKGTTASAVESLGSIIGKAVEAGTRKSKSE